jgi:hypothetical protein
VILKKVILDALASRGLKLARLDAEYPIEISIENKNDIESCNRFTMIGISRLVCNVIAMKYVEENSLVGDVVETGVWKGGSIALLARTSLDFGNHERTFWAFDTFAGMPEPGSLDEKFAHDKFAELKDHSGYSDWCRANETDVRSNIEHLCGSLTNFKFVKGKVEETLKIEENLPTKISLLRIDTDWYDSTRAALEVLYPKVVSGGVVIVDDYGAWSGSQIAVDEFFSKFFKPLMLPFGSSRIFVKQ